MLGRIASEANWAVCTIEALPTLLAFMGALAGRNLTLGRTNAARGWAGAASFQNRVPWSSVEQHYQLDDALYRGVAPKGCVARFADAKVRKVWDRAGNRTRARYPHLRSSI